MAGAGEMCVREADDGAVVVAVAGRPAVALAARLDAGVRAELDHAERQRGAGVGVALAAGANERIDRHPRGLARLGLRAACNGEGKHQGLGGMAKAMHVIGSRNVGPG